jgi:folate-dependent phosphoribosylglycinamide formyltransferase PurN
MSGGSGAPPLLLLASDGPSSRMVHHALREEFGDLAVVVERPPSRWALLKRRARILGPATAFGQLLFLGAAVPLLRRASRRRVEAIRVRHGLVESPLPQTAVHVGSVNSDEAIRALREASPKVVVVNGTRIISSRTLESLPAIFLNMHMGITPQYRGVHGGYWALFDGRPDMVGTTIHIVDSGIDTGRVVGRAFFGVTGEDDFSTYPYLHAAAGLQILVTAVRTALSGGAGGAAELPGVESRLRTHPTLYQYMHARLTRNVR